MNAFHTLWNRGKTIRRWFVEHNERRRSIRELSSLSDRQLKDIGVTRGQIPEVVETMLARKLALEAAERASARRTSASPAGRERAPGDTMTGTPA